MEAGAWRRGWGEDEVLCVRQVVPEHGVDETGERDITTSRKGLSRVDARQRRLLRHATKAPPA